MRATVWKNADTKGHVSYDWFHLYVIFQIGKFIETESQLGPGGERKKWMEVSDRLTSMSFPFVVMTTFQK